MKLLPRLLGGFVLVALIVVGVGYFGVTGSARLSGQLDAVGKVVLPSATGILRMRLAMSEIHSSEQALLRKGLGDSERADAYSMIASAKQELDKARDAYNAIPKTPAEKALWDRFNSTWDSWWKVHLAFEDLEKDHRARPFDQLADMVYDQTISQTLDQAAVPFDALTKILADIDLLQFQYAAAALSSGARATAQVRLATAAGFAAGPLLALLFGFLIAISISRSARKRRRVCGKRCPWRPDSAPGDCAERRGGETGRCPQQHGGKAERADEGHPGERAQGCLLE